MNSTQSIRMKVSRKLWRKFRAEMRDHNSTYGERRQAEDQMIKCRNSYLEERQVWAHERTAAALAEAQAEVARLREALGEIVAMDEIDTSKAMYMFLKSFSSMDFEDAMKRAYDLAIRDVAKVARAALETAPAGEA